MTAISCSRAFHAALAQEPRPAYYSDAIVVVDAMLWWNADPALVHLACPATLPAVQWRSLIARALIFRLLAFDSTQPDMDERNDQFPRYARVLDLLRR